MHSSHPQEMPTPGGYGSQSSYILTIRPLFKFVDPFPANDDFIELHSVFERRFQPGIQIGSNLRNGNNMDNHTPVDPEKQSRIEHGFQLFQRLIYEIAVTIHPDQVNHFIVCFKKTDFFGINEMQF